MINYFIDFNMFYTHYFKSQINVILNQTINIIINCFQQKVIFI